MPEMGAVGQAQVLAIEPCPEIESGPGQVVTATFCHEPDDNILDVWVGDQHKPIGVTDTHPWWSEDRQAFVAVGQMQVGEQVWTHGLGVVPIRKIAKRVREAWVYNLEVQGEHVYEVSALGVLVHNQNGGGESKTNNAGSEGTPSEGSSGTPGETGQSPPSSAPVPPNYVNNNPKASAGKIKIGEMLNSEAQAGNIPGVKEVQRAAESGVNNVRSGDSRFVNENGTVTSADLLQSSSAKPKNVFTHILDKAGQAETIVVELLPPKAGKAITNEEAAQIATDVLSTSAKILRVIFVRDGRIVVDTFEQELGYAKAFLCMRSCHQPFAHSKRERLSALLGAQA